MHIELWAFYKSSKQAWSTMNTNMHQRWPPDLPMAQIACNKTHALINLELWASYTSQQCMARDEYEQTPKMTSRQSMAQVGCRSLYSKLYVEKICLSRTATQQIYNCRGRASWQCVLMNMLSSDWLLALYKSSTQAWLTMNTNQHQWWPPALPMAQIAWTKNCTLTHALTYLELWASTLQLTMHGPRWIRTNTKEGLQIYRWHK